MTERASPKPEIKKEQVDTLANLLSNTENIAALHGKKFSEVFADDESIRSYIEELNQADFIELLNSINGVIQSKDKKGWTMAKGSVPITGGEGVRGSGYTPPNAQDRLMLFAEVLNAMQEMAKDERSLEDIAILLSSSVNAIHAYSDANGRTSRLLYLLLAKGLNESTKPIIQQALSEGGRDVVDVSFEEIENDLLSALHSRIKLKRPNGSWESEKNRIDITFDESLPDKLMSELVEMLADITYSSIALHRYLDDKPDAEKYLKHYPENEFLYRKWPERYNVKVDDLFQTINEEDAKNILQIYRQIKNEMMRLLIDSAVHPSEAEYTDADGTTILGKFKQNIKMRSRN